MKRTKYRYGWIALGVLIATAFAFWKFNNFNDKIMSASASNSPMKTLCVGRYLIDVPNNYKFENYHYRIDGVDVSGISKVKDLQSFDAALSGRKAKLMADENGYQKPSLEEPKETHVRGMKVVILPYDRRPPTGYMITKDGKEMRDETENLSAEAWVWTGGQAIKLEGKGLGQGLAQEALLRLIQPLQDLTADAIPTEAGFCMQMFDARAMIAGVPTSKKTYEGVEIQFGLEDHPDVKFRMVFYPNLGEKLFEPLLERDARASGDMKEYANRISILRKQRRVVHDMDGEELVKSFREENGTRGLSFDWEWLGRLSDPYAPDIQLEAKTGWSNDGPVQSSLSDEGALKIWDSVLNSIHVRPAPEVKASQVTPTQPLGHLAATGRTCEQTGLWECDESRATESQRHRFIQFGEPMPHVFVVSEPGLWGRLKGTSGSPAQVATMWKLISYDKPVAALEAAPESDVPHLPIEPAGDVDG